jgi:deoxyribodipyrimidine photolyase-like uncharacterized protein
MDHKVSKSNFSAVFLRRVIGIREYVRAVTQLTYSKVIPPHRVHELVGLKDMYGNPPFSIESQSRSAGLKSNEVSGSRDILPEKDGS